MSMIDSMVLFWRSPSFFTWNRLIFEIYLLVDHSIFEIYLLVDNKLVKISYKLIVVVLQAKCCVTLSHLNGESNPW